MYKDLASVGIYHLDIRKSNIVVAPRNSPVHARTSPNWQKGPYRWRIIDFHKSVKSNVALPLISIDQVYGVRSLLSGFDFGEERDELDGLYRRKGKKWN